MTLSLNVVAAVAIYLIFFLHPVNCQPKPNDKEYNTEEAMLFKAYTNQLKINYKGGVDRGRGPPASQGLASFHLNRVPTVFYRYNLMEVGTRLLLVFTNNANSTLAATTKPNHTSRNLCGFVTTTASSEIKACMDSMQAMKNFVVPILGHNLSVLTTPRGKLQYYWVTGEAMTIADEGLACHNKGTLDASLPNNDIYSCHYVANSQVRLVPLVGQDGTRFQALTVCHLNTSDWDANGVPLQLLKIKPGPPFGHYLSTNDLVWFRPVKLAPSPSVTSP